MGLRRKPPPFSPPHCVSVLRGLWLGLCSPPSPPTAPRHTLSVLWTAPAVHPGCSLLCVVGTSLTSIWSSTAFPGQPFCGLSRQLLTQVKHQALGAVNVIRCPHLRWL